MSANAETTVSNDPVQRVSLYVGDLHPDTTESDLHDAFCKIGPIVSVHLCRCAGTGKSLCYAYVNFHNHSDASKAMACLNYTDLKGKPMRIMWYQRDPSQRKFGSGNLFIKNLDSSVKGSCLLGLFCQFGTVISCKVAEENGKSKGFGFVQFDSEESAIAARTALHDTKFRGKKLYVSKFVKKMDRTSTGENLKFTNLYVKNLVEDMTEDELHEMFSKFGKVSNVVIMKDEEGKSRGFGFVNFESPEEAGQAVEALNGAQMGSKILFVGKAQKKDENSEILKHEYEDTFISHIEKLKASNLYVKNLNASADDKKLQELFGGFGRIISSKVMRDNNGTSKGFGFVCFSSPGEAKNALNTLNGTNFEGRTLYVAIAQSKEDRQKELQSLYAKFRVLSSYHPNYSDTIPQYSLFYYSYNPSSPPFPLLHQAVLCQQYGTKNYQQNHYCYIPMRQTHLESTGNASNWSCHEPYLTFSTSTVCTEDQKRGNYLGQKPGNRIKGSEKCGPTECASKGAASGCFAVATSSLNKKSYTEDVQLQPVCVTKTTGLLSDMKNSEIIDLRNLTKQAHIKTSPKSLAKQADNTVQVLKEANARTSGDDSVALPKPVSCLSY